MKKVFFTLIGFFLIITTAYANAGVPMIGVIWPMYWILLIPIILIETGYAKRCLPAIPFKKIFWPTTVANIISTLIGIPIVYGVFLLMQMYVIPGGTGVYGLSDIRSVILSVTVQAPWLLPYEKNLFWMMPVAIMFLLIPFYFASAWIESFILTKFFNIYFDRALMKRISWKANQMSYLFLFLFCLGALSYNTFEHFHPKPERIYSEEELQEMYKLDPINMSEPEFEEYLKNKEKESSSKI